MYLARSRPTVLTWFMDASWSVLEHLHSGTLMPRGGVHTIRAQAGARGGNGQVVYRPVDGSVVQAYGSRLGPMRGSKALSLLTLRSMAMPAFAAALLPAMGAPVSECRSSPNQSREAE